jgi:hypothetical protein
MIGYPGWEYMLQMLTQGGVLKICLHLNEDSSKPKVRCSHAQEKHAIYLLQKKSIRSKPH